MVFNERVHNVVLRRCRGSVHRTSVLLDRSVRSLAILEETGCPQADLDTGWMYMVSLTHHGLTSDTKELDVTLSAFHQHSNVVVVVGLPRKLLLLLSCHPKTCMLAVWHVFFVTTSLVAKAIRLERDSTRVFDTLSCSHLRIDISQCKTIL